MDEFLQEEMRSTLRAFKENPSSPKLQLPVFLFGRKAAFLIAFSRDDLNCGETMSLLIRWHRHNTAGGPSLAASAVLGAKRWLLEQVLDSPDHLLFWVRGLDGRPIGHVGLSGVDAAQKQVEIGFALRGVRDVLPGVMYAATQALICWAFQSFPLRQAVLKVFPSNRPALCLAERCGFAGASEVIAARPVEGSKNSTVVALSLTRASWMEAHRIVRAA
jgi:RimJ/RimL family protein N-acetyltransferase